MPATVSDPLFSAVISSEIESLSEKFADISKGSTGAGGGVGNGTGGGVGNDRPVAVFVGLEDSPSLNVAKQKNRGRGGEWEG